jgi:hypothetical protein
MDGICIVNSSFGGDGEHRLDFKLSTQYETEYACLDCGEIVIHYHNAGC